MVLPHELLIKIFYYLSPNDIYNLIYPLSVYYNRNNLKINMKFLVKDYTNIFINYKELLCIYSTIETINRHNYLDYYSSIYNYFSFTSEFDYLLCHQNRLETYILKNVLSQYIKSEYKTKFINICKFIDSTYKNTTESNFNLKDFPNSVFNEPNFIKFLHTLA